MIIGCTVPEIWYVNVIVIFHLLWAIFCPPPPSPPLTTQKVKISKQKVKKKMLGDFIILHMCTKNYD